MKTVTPAEPVEKVTPVAAAKRRPLATLIQIPGKVWQRVVAVTERERSLT